MHRRGENLGISILRRIVSCGKAVWYSDGMKCNQSNEKDNFTRKLAYI
jgi:hypothetical protein